ncbi:MAG TPA: ABC transporter permease [Panacibacter sp.]|nr:ABC transporter permease [Panacibacter sp.]
MLKHLFKLIWNKKKQNALLISEIFISFIVIFAVFTLIVYNYQNYKKPMGFDYDNVWTASYTNALQTENNDSLSLFYETVRKTVKSMPEVKEVSFSSNNVPFYQNTSQGGIGYKGNNISSVNWYQVEIGYKDVMNMKVLDGRWFTKEDIVAKNTPIVINETLKNILFGNESAVGKITEGDKKVIGVVQDVKAKGDYAPSGTAVYASLDTGSFRWLGKIVIKVIPGADAAFEGKLYKTLANSMKNSSVEIEHLTDKRTSINYFSLVPMIVLLIVAFFLIINVALGLFGVLWYNINKRRGEIGLRRAVGASGNAVSKQLVGEALVLTTFALIIGSFFAVQFPLLNVFDLSANIYIIALLSTIVFIYLLVIICAFYPGRQAAAVYPAVALHEE